MVDQRIPIRARRDDGDVVRILLLDGWYGALKPVYDFFKYATGVGSVKEAPFDLDAATELFNGLILEFGANGWIFTVSLLTVLCWAVKRAIDLGKFTYQVTGFGEGGFGEGPFGGGPVVHEIPIDE